MLERVELDAVQLESASLEIEESPLSDIKYTGDIEADAAAEFGVVESEFRKRNSDEKARFQKATDSEYWCCLCFQDRAQAQAFAAAIGMDPTAKYMDGQKVAEKLGIKIPASPLPFGTAKIDKKLVRLAMEG